MTLTVLTLIFEATRTDDSWDYLPCNLRFDAENGRGRLVLISLRGEATLGLRETSRCAYFVFERLALLMHQGSVLHGTSEK